MLNRWYRLAKSPAKKATLSRLHGIIHTMKASNISQLNPQEIESAFATQAKKMADQTA